MSNQKQTYKFSLNEVDSETPVIELGERFNLSRVGPNGFFAYLLFDASFTGSVQIHLGASRDNLKQINDLDMTLTGDQGPHTYDVGTRARWMKLKIISGSAFNCEVEVNR